MSDLSEIIFKSRGLYEQESVIRFLKEVSIASGRKRKVYSLHGVLLSVEEYNSTNQHLSPRVEKYRSERSGEVGFAPILEWYFNKLDELSPNISKELEAKMDKSGILKLRDKFMINNYKDLLDYIIGGKAFEAVKYMNRMGEYPEYANVENPEYSKARIYYMPPFKYSTLLKLEKYLGGVFANSPTLVHMKNEQFAAENKDLLDGETVRMISYQLLEKKGFNPPKLNINGRTTYGSQILPGVYFGSPFEEVEGDKSRSIMDFGDRLGTELRINDYFRLREYITLLLMYILEQQPLRCVDEDVADLLLYITNTVGYAKEGKTMFEEDSLFYVRALTLIQRVSFKIRTPVDEVVFDKMAKYIFTFPGFSNAVLTGIREAFENVMGTLNDSLDSQIIMSSPVDGIVYGGEGPKIFSPDSLLINLPIIETLLDAFHEMGLNFEFELGLGIKNKYPKRLKNDKGYPASSYMILMRNAINLSSHMSGYTQTAKIQSANRQLLKNIVKILDAKGYRPNVEFRNVGHSKVPYQDVELIANEKFFKIIHDVAENVGSLSNKRYMTKEQIKLMIQQRVTNKGSTVKIGIKYGKSKFDKVRFGDKVLTVPYLYEAFEKGDVFRIHKSELAKYEIKISGGIGYSNASGNFNIRLGHAIDVGDGYLVFERRIKRPEVLGVGEDLAYYFPFFGKVTIGGRNVPTGKFSRAIFVSAVMAWMYGQLLVNLLSDGMYHDSANVFFRGRGNVLADQIDNMIQTSPQNWSNLVNMDDFSGFDSTITPNDRLGVAFGVWDSMQSEASYEFCDSGLNYRKVVISSLMYFVNQVITIQAKHGLYTELYTGMGSGEPFTIDVDSIINASFNILKSEDHIIQNLLSSRRLIKVLGDDSLTVFDPCEFNVIDELSQEYMDWGREKYYETRDAIMSQIKSDYLRNALEEGMRTGNEEIAHRLLGFRRRVLELAASCLKALNTKGGMDFHMSIFLLQAFIGGYFIANQRMQMMVTETGTENDNAIIQSALITVEGRGNVMPFEYYTYYGLQILGGEKMRAVYLLLLSKMRSLNKTVRKELLDVFLGLIGDKEGTGVHFTMIDIKNALNSKPHKGTEIVSSIVDLVIEGELNLNDVEELVESQKKGSVAKTFILHSNFISSEWKGEIGVPTSSTTGYGRTELRDKKYIIGNEVLSYDDFIGRFGPIEKENYLRSKAKNILTAVNKGRFEFTSPMTNDGSRVVLKKINISNFYKPAFSPEELALSLSVPKKEERQLEKYVSSRFFVENFALRDPLESILEAMSKNVSMTQIVKFSDLLRYVLKIGFAKKMVVYNTDWMASFKEAFKVDFVLSKYEPNPTLFVSQSVGSLVKKIRMSGERNDIGSDPIAALKRRTKSIIVKSLPATSIIGLIFAPRSVMATAANKLAMTIDDRNSLTNFRDTIAPIYTSTDSSFTFGTDLLPILDLTTENMLGTIETDQTVILPVKSLYALICGFILIIYLDNMFNMSDMKRSRQNMLRYSYEKAIIRGTPGTRELRKYIEQTIKILT
jgi:hypothetical protein